MQVHEWKKLPVSLTELCINTTLRCGQSFRYYATYTVLFPLTTRYSNAASDGESLPTTNGLSLYMDGF